MVVINGTTLKIQIIRKKSHRSLSMSVERDGTVVVKSPLSVPDDIIERFIEENRSFVERMIRKYDERNLLKKYQDGEKFLYLGREYELKIVQGQTQPLVLSDKFYLSVNFLDQARKTFLSWYKKEASRVISSRVKHYALLGGHTYGKITVKDLQKAWGTCSSNRNLSFNWRVVMAPIEVLDYVVVHELSHLRELNHSKRFWQEVEKLMPDYDEKDMWLRRNGHLLDL